MQDETPAETADMRIMKNWTGALARTCGLAAAMVAVAEARAQSEIGLSLVGPASFVEVGQVVEVRLRASSESVSNFTGTSFVAIDCILGWDPAHLRLLGLSTAGSVPLLSSYFPNPSVDYTGINEASPPQDGDALYYALAPLGNPIGCQAPGVQVTTFRFQVLSEFESTVVEIIPTLTVDFIADTIVYDGTVPGLDVTGTLAGCTLLQEPPCAGSLEGIGPAFDGLPESLVLATDAGSLVGALVSAPVVSARDACDEPLAVSLALTGATEGSSWPVDGVFPIGTTTLTWTAVDEVGNIATEVRTIVVEDHQLLDAAISFEGVFAGDSTRSIRIAAGGLAQVVTVDFTGAEAFVAGLEIPVAEGYDCVSAKDVTHSISSVAAPSVSGARYAAEFLLTQGDSNDDDAVDVLDYGLLFGDLGGPVARNAISNFNADILVNNADFSVIAINFFEVGASCGAFEGAAPRSRVSVKDLRRAGLGHLAAADLDRNGWLDLRDVARFAEYGAGPNVRGGGDGAIR
ncbi:MAG: hypothetical protein RI967_1723 [Planctomycetota bacterium]